MVGVTRESDALDRMASDLRVAAFLLTRRMRLESRLDDVTDSQLTVLLHLRRVGPQTPGQLAEFERVSAPSMNRTINALVEAGWVGRVDDPADGRRVIVQLTPEGAELARTTSKRRNAWLKEQLRPLDAQDRAALARATELISRMARQ